MTTVIDCRISAQILRTLPIVVVVADGVLCRVVPRPSPTVTAFSVLPSTGSLTVDGGRSRLAGFRVVAGVTGCEGAVCARFSTDAVRVSPPAATGLRRAVRAHTLKCLVVTVSSGRAVSTAVGVRNQEVFHEHPPGEGRRVSNWLADPPLWCANGRWLAAEIIENI